MKIPFGRRPGGTERETTDLYGVKKVEALEPTIQYLAAEKERLPNGASILSELNILGATRDLSPQRREELVGEVLNERENPGEKGKPKD